MNFGIVGAGLIGKKRAAALNELGCPVLAVCDISSERANDLASVSGAQSYSSIETLLTHPKLDAVVIATTNDAAVSSSVAALKAGKHVLVEKPAGRNPEELKRLVASSKESDRFCGVGFNHRFHPGLEEAARIVREEELGPLMYIRARYGHGGRVGYDREWRADPALGGGGELLDQGVHLIDLCRWMGGELNLDYGFAPTTFWDMPVEDNGFLMLKSPTKKFYAWLHASCTEWKNLFDFEIFCRNGKLQIPGLGRSYGREELKIFRMKPEMGPPDLEVRSYPEEDLSWQNETLAFLDAIEGKKTAIGTPEDALRSVEIVYEAYRQSGRV